MNKNFSSPKVGDTFYWKDQDGDIHENKVLKIENQENVETMYFIHISNNGGGCFVTESDILDPFSKDVIEFKKVKAKQIMNDFTNQLKSNPNLRSLFYNALTNNHICEDDTEEILDILTHYEIQDN